MNRILRSKGRLRGVSAAATLLVAVLSIVVSAAQADQGDYADTWGPSLDAPVPLLAATPDCSEQQSLRARRALPQLYRELAWHGNGFPPGPAASPLSDIFQTD